LTEWQEVLFWTQIEQLITERDAMHAANSARQAEGKADAYGEEKFMALADRFADIENRIRECG
jgi:tRNA A37 threonylcarbamoyladenosine dehydratase